MRAPQSDGGRAAWPSTRRMKISSSRFTLLRMLSTSMPSAERRAKMSLRFCSFDTSISSVWSSTRSNHIAVELRRAAPAASRRFSTKVSTCSLRSRLRHAIALGDLPAVDDGDVAAERLGLFQIVRREDDGGAVLVDLAQELPHRAADLDVHAGRRLIEDQQARLVHQRARDHQPALHAAGQAARHLLRLSQSCSCFRYFSARSRASAALDAVETRLIDQDGLRRLEHVEVDFLRHDADAGLGRLELAVDVVPEDADACPRSC